MFSRGVISSSLIFTSGFLFVATTSKLSHVGALSYDEILSKFLPVSKLITSTPLNVQYFEILPTLSVAVAESLYDLESQLRINVASPFFKLSFVSISLAPL
ncbi:MAG: hypothetical protein ACLS27_06265 [Eubacterium sp.]